jgi:hypothetical protein
MMTVQDYLNQHYWDADTLAAKQGLTTCELDRMIEEALIPKPSYVVAGCVITSAAFGDLDAQGANDGAYFHPANSNWIERAQRYSSTQTANALKMLYFDNMANELAAVNRDIYRLADAFDEQARPLQKGLDERITSYWNSFLQGIFGLCVSNPVSEREIVWKEVLQEKLTAVTANGARFENLDLSRSELFALIDAYEHASMPFSPVEYPMSSRKRLVDDLRKKCAAGQ